MHNQRMFCMQNIFITITVFALSAFQLVAADLKIVETSSGKPPSDAIVLFDGHGTEAFLSTCGTPCPWPVVDGAMVTKDEFIVSKLHFRNAQIHVEFAMPEGCEGKAKIGNSGVYIHGLFELQIINWQTEDLSPKKTIGSIYNHTPPLVNAGRRPGQWQTYDILFTAPRHDQNGEIETPGAITAMLNGVLVQYNTPITKSVSTWNPLVYRNTPYTDKIRDSIQKTDMGPLFLQYHHSPVKFRNIWIRTLD